MAPFLYEEHIRYLVTQLKYGRNLACARLLGDLLADHLAESAVCLPELVMPVPLHPSRIRERGFNQALEIARVVARRVDAPLDSASLRRTRATPAQAELPRRQRLTNLRGAFHLCRTPSVSHIALVDDVVTTGSTAAEISRQLKQSGVTEVSVWAVARTPE